MCIYTVKKQNNFKNKKFLKGVSDSTERPKIRHLWRKGYCKNSQRFMHVMLHTGRI